MSRSNGPGAPPNGWPADYRPTEASDPYQDPYYTQQQRPAGPPPQQPAPARAPRIQTAPAQSRVPQTGLPPNLAQGGPPQQNYAPQAYPGQQPPQGYGQQYAQPQYAPQSPPQAYAPQQPQAPAYAPQHVQPQQPRTLPPAARQPAPQQPHNDPRFAPFGNYDAPPAARPAPPVQQPSQYPPAYTPAPSAYVPETTGRPTQPPQPQRSASPYDQQWQQPAPQQSAPALDPHGYDLGHYQPSAAPSAGADPRTQRGAAPPAWTPHAEPEARQHAQAPGFAPQFQTEPHAGNQALEPVHDDDYEDHEDDEEYEDAPRKTRYGLIAASLIAAIAAGGGLAYAYKMYVAPSQHTASAPVIKSNTGPIKVKPVDAGGTKFANADSKMMENLSGSADTNSDGGPKQVKTMVIERDGSVASAQSAAPPPPSAPVASGGVPGMILANVPPPPAAQPAAVAAVVNPPVQQAPRPAPKVIAAAPAPAAYPDPVDTAPVAAAPAAPVKKVVPKKITPAAGPAPTTAPSAVGGPKGANGFVAVLASVPASGSSRVEAMQQYADLQQKFGGVLGSKAPDVVEAKLPAGVYHRLIVGPPASRDAATSVCTQLKAAGYTADCWVTAF